MGRRLQRGQTARLGRQARRRLAATEEPFVDPLDAGCREHARERVDGDLRQALGRAREAGDLPVRGGLAHEALPYERRHVDREHRPRRRRDRRVVAVAVPHADGQGVGAVGPAALRGRRDVAVRVEILGVVVGTGLERRRSAGALGSTDPELAPVRVDPRRRVAVEDVGHDVRGLWTDDLHRGCRGRQLDLRAGAVLDADDRGPLDARAAVAERPVCADEVDRSCLGDAECERHARVGRGALEGHAEVLRPREEVVGLVEGGRLDGRDVERELERVADADRPPLEVVGIGRRVAAAEVGGAVHEHVAGREGPVVDADDVVERLERRARLAEALRDDVVLRLELGSGRRRVVARRADVRDDLAGLVVERDERPVADVLVLEVAHPRLVVVEAEPFRELGRPRVMRCKGRHADPLLGRLLEPQVERRDDAEATLGELVAGRSVGPADLAGEFLLDRPHEVGRSPAGRRLAGEGDLLALGGLEVRAADRTVRHRHPVVGHQVEDRVPTLGDPRVRPEHEMARGGRALFALGRRLVAAHDRVAHEVVVGWRLRQRRQQRCLSGGQLRELLAEVRPRGGLHSVALVAVVVEVEVRGEDLALARLARVRLRQADRLDDLLELPLDGSSRVRYQVLVEQTGADQLLGDRRRAATLAAQRIDARGDDGRRVEARVVPERLVLDRRGRVHQDRRDLVEFDDLALELAEPRELGLAGAVVEHGLLGDGHVREIGHRGKSVRQRCVDGDRRDSGDDADAGQEREQDHGEPARRRPPRRGGSARGAGL